jgi:DNA-binding response OmpR family regulator
MVSCWKRGGTWREGPRAGESMDAGTILVVEDEEDIATIVRVALEMEGLAVHVTGSFRQAVHALKSSRPKAVVMDVLLPDGSGLTLLRRLRNDPDLADVPVVMLSAISPQDELWHGTWEWDAYIQKPFDPTDVVTTIQKLVKTASN